MNNIKLMNNNNMINNQNLQQKIPQKTDPFANLSLNNMNKKNENNNNNNPFNFV
jgi:hypothetical protein